MIRAKQIAKSFQGLKALDGVSLHVDKGEICAVLGVKGAGKTTLADILAGCEDATGGAAEICSVPMDSLSGLAKQHVGYMPAVPPLYKDMTARTYLKFVGEAHGYSSRQLSELIALSLKRTGMDEYSDVLARRLSDGGKRLLSLAQATLCEPDVIIMDDPTEGLDARDTVKLREIIAEFREEYATLILTDNITEAARLCDRAYILDGGRIIAEGDPKRLGELLADDGALALRVKGDIGAVKAALSGLGEVEAREADEPGAVDASVRANPVKGVRPDIRVSAFSALVKANLTILSMTSATKPLDEVILALKREPLAPEGEAEADESGN